MAFEVRPARSEDKPRILEISAQIWEGDDYVPAVVDDWLAAPGSELVVASLAGELIAFAHLRWLSPEYVWLEGIRTDPAHRNLGAGNALTDALLERAARGGARRAGLSTYVDNRASIHIIETHGFRRVVSFVYLECPAQSPAWAAASPSDRVENVPVGEAAAFVAGSRFLAVTNGYFPQGWMFYPFSLGPALALGGRQHLLGTRREGQLTALLVAGRSSHGDTNFGVDFLDGDEEECETLLRHTLHIAREWSAMAARVPKLGDQVAPALPLFRQLGFEARNGFEADIFVYEHAL